MRIFSTPSLMVSHNAPEVHILIEDERNIVVPTYGYGSTTSGDVSNTGQRGSNHRQDRVTNQETKNRHASNR